MLILLKALLAGIGAFLLVQGTFRLSGWIALRSTKTPVTTLHETEMWKLFNFLSIAIGCVSCYIALIGGLLHIKTWPYFFCGPVIGGVAVFAAGRRFAQRNPYFRGRLGPFISLPLGMIAGSLLAVLAI